MKLSELHYVFILLNVILIPIFNFNSNGGWILEILYFYYIFILIATIYVCRGILNRYFLGSALAKLAILYLSTHIVIVIAFVILNRQDITFVQKFIYLYEEVDFFYFFTLPYIISFITVLAMYKTVCKKRDSKVYKI